MHRIFVYVNVTTGHIMIHPERLGPCGDVFKHVKKGGAHPVDTQVERLEDDTIKIADTPNGYWLVFWADTGENLLQRQSLLDIAKKGNIPEGNIHLCEHCK